MTSVFRIASVLESAQAGAIREQEQVVLVFGPNAIARNVTAALEALENIRCTNIVLTTREQLADFQTLIDADRIFYLSCGELSERDLDALIEGPAPSDELFLPADDLRRMATAENVAEVADAVERAIGGVVDTARSRCLLFDREQQLLWNPGETNEEASAAVGLASFIVRTGETVCLAQLDGDPRVDRDLDNPDGHASDRFLGVPVRAPRGAIVAVLIALRPKHGPAFQPSDVAVLERLASHASSYFATWLVQTPNSPFRHNALRELDQPLLAGPEPLRLHATWTRDIPWLAVATFAALLLALSLAAGFGHG